MVRAASAPGAMRRRPIATMRSRRRPWRWALNDGWHRRCTLHDGWRCDRARSGGQHRDSRSYRGLRSYLWRGLARAGTGGAHEHRRARAAKEERAEHGHEDDRCRGTTLLRRGGPRGARWRTVPVGRITLRSRTVRLPWRRPVALRCHRAVGLRGSRAHRLEASSLSALVLLPRRRRRALHRVDDVAANPSPAHCRRLRGPAVATPYADHRMGTFAFQFFVDSPRASGLRQRRCSRIRHPRP
jgi:hypothetical protein